MKLISLIKYLFNWLQSTNEDFTIDFYTDPSIDKSKLIDIYFVHGFVDKSHTFSHLITELKKNLPDHIKSINSIAIKLTEHQLNIKSFAKILLTKIKQNKHKNVLLIGHSRGGIISAYAAEALSHGRGIDIRGVVAIAAPFSGTKYAMFPLTALFASVSEMQTDSEFLTKLKSAIAKNEKQIPYLFISASDDILIDVDSSYVASDNMKHEIINDCGHLTILYSKQLPGIIHNFIKQITI